MKFIKLFAVFSVLNVPASQLAVDGKLYLMVNIFFFTATDLSNHAYPICIHIIVAMIRK